MNWTGVVENGIVKLPSDWKDGTHVLVEALDAAEPINDLTRKFLELSQKVSGLPTDLAVQHDHYLYGTPKK